MDKKKRETKPTYSGPVPAVDQALRILLHLVKSPSPKVNLTDICKSVGIYKSKGHSILKTLHKYGIVQKNPEGKTYSLGLGLISLSRKVLDNLNHSEVAGPFLEDLSGKTHSTALFGLISGDNAFVVAKHEADQSIGVTTRVGHRFSITHGAHGKAIYAFLSEVEQKKMLAQKRLLFHGHESKFDRKRLEREVAECRKTGYAVDTGDLIPGINIIAAPAFDTHGSLLGSIFIMGTFPESRISEYGAIVAETARQFSSMLGADLEETYKMPLSPG